MSNIARSRKAEGKEKLTLSQKINDFLRKYRTLVLAVVGAALLVVIVVAIWSFVHASAIEASTTKLEKVQDDVATLAFETDQAKKDALQSTITGELDEIIAKWPKLYAGQRARVIKANLAVEKKDWAAAESEWLAAADARKDSYLAPIALQGAARAAEERGAPEKAVEYLARFVADYGSSPGIARAYFTLGRLAEESKDYPTALGHYEKIVSVASDDDWTKLAKDRIISLKSRGLAQ